MSRMLHEYGPGAATRTPVPSAATARTAAGIGRLRAPRVAHGFGGEPAVADTSN